MSKVTLMINNTSYTSFASVEEADKWVHVSPYATAWDAKTDDDKSLLLVEATNLIISLPGFTETPEGITPAGDVGSPVENACSRIAGTLISTETGQTVRPLSTAASTELQEISAGDVTTKFFRGPQADINEEANSLGITDQIAYRLLLPYISTDPTKSTGQRGGGTVTYGQTPPISDWGQVNY